MAHEHISRPSDFGENETAKEEAKEGTAIHMPGRLFDEPAHDEATGKKVSTSDLEAADKTLHIVRKEGEGEDMMGALPDDADDAASWLSQNDPERRP